jgi:hypothetical protein
MFIADGEQQETSNAALTEFKDKVNINLLHIELPQANL